MPPHPLLAPCLNRFCHSSFPVFSSSFWKGRACVHAVLSVCYLASVSLSSDFMLYFRLCQNVVAILGLNGSCFRVILHTFLHLFSFFTFSIHPCLYYICIHTHTIHTASIFDVCSHCDCMCPSLNENMTGQITCIFTRLTLKKKLQLTAIMQFAGLSHFKL